MRQGRKVNKKKINRKSERAAKYKAAFDEIIGDPYTKPEPIDGEYLTLKNSSAVRIGGTDVTQKSSKTIAEARPNVVDFCCDVESAIKDGLEIFEWRENLDQKIFIFSTTYFTEYPEYYKFTQLERAVLEQHIGRILISRGISPVRKYFTFIKQ